MKLFNSKNSNKGFTLIEILIAVSIVAIMMAIIISSAAALQKNSRDARRKSDLGSLTTSLQQYYADQSYYPATLTLTSVGSLKNPANTVTYLNKTPIDPIAGSSTPYVYIALPSSPACDNTVGNYCNNFCLYSKLEFGATVKVPVCEAVGNKPTYDTNFIYEASQP